ncbi:MAG TPA: 4-alpha-glucanotransferase [Chlamydiales bacterium]|nr:4-alpha-glucanotransferase [Chlamydiales bacterium]
MKTDAHWKPIGFHPHHGICLPLSALRTQKSCGTGEFLDLIPLIDWCKSLHLDCIQLLPLNDSGSDPSPYNPLSSCALDPIYLSLSDLNIPPFDAPHSRLEVLHQKLALLRTHFTSTFPALSRTPRYRAFVEQNPWLESYSHFKALKDLFNGQNCHDWPSPTPTLPRAAIDFYSYLQFHCFDQLERVRAHATSQHVFLKGDIPILLSPDSVDVWVHPNLFRLDLEAGAPPDNYNRLGQKWGFPLFNWEVMRKTGYVWWKQRLKIAEKFFHIYRIDHVVGFFRIWGIPKDNQPTDGSFFPPDRSLWVPQGKEHLEMFLNASPLLPIAEDLGTIPKEVYPVLKELGICGTKVIRWQKEDDHFIPFHEYEPFSMTTVSTPDLAPLELWWKKVPAESVPFAQFMHWTYHPILTNDQRFAILRASHHTSSIFHINLLQEYLALFPELVWPNPEEEQINIPGTILPNNWTYRFRPSLEEIVAHEGLRAAFARILAQ